MVQNKTRRGRHDSPMGEGEQGSKVCPLSLLNSSFRTRAVHLVNASLRLYCVELPSVLVSPCFLVVPLAMLAFVD